MLYFRHLNDAYDVKNNAKSQFTDDDSVLVAFLTLKLTHGSSLGTYRFDSQNEFDRDRRDVRTHIPALFNCSCFGE